MTFLKKAYDDKRTFQKVVIVLIVICTIVGIACINFYNQVRQTVQDESEHYLREISNRISSNIERTIADNFAILETMRKVLEDNQGYTFEQVSSFMKQQEDHWDFYKAMMIDEGGTAYDFEGKEVSITGDSFLRKLTPNKAMIAPTQIINNEETLIFATPLNATINGKKMKALATCYKPESFDQLLSMASFDEQAYSYIVDKKGKTITRSSSAISGKFGYNIINTLANNGLNDKDEIEELKKAMKKEKASQFEFVIGDSTEYLVYTPIQLDGWELFTFVPVTVVNTKSNLLLRNTLLISGLIFLVFFMFLMIIIFSFSRHKKKLEQIAYVDTLTKGNTIQRFNDLVKDALKDGADHYALIFTNIQRFKVLNDQFGRATCDQIIVSIHDGISHSLNDGEYIGHQAADNFHILVKYDSKEDLEKRLYDWRIEMGNVALETLNAFPLFVMEYGIYVIEDKNVALEDMMDRTKLSLRDSTIVHGQNDYIHFAYYDDATRAQMLLEKHLEDMMDSALKENEFKVYLQPKYMISNDEIGGAEALVRWQSKQDGMIYPNAFIPLFEKNGFIIRLDLWMFEQVCMLLQKWQDSGKKLVKVSVNCSRAHLKDPNFLSAYGDIFEKYTFPSEYLELEFTENMVFEDTLFLAKVIDDIHTMGFGCSMDDFGSGYSSLNLLQDIHVDTLKLDRVFFKNDFKNDPRTKAIISCVLDMAQSLKMTTVAEGIEEWEQVDSLRAMGCDYVQGFVYAKPMPIRDFEEILFSKEEKTEDK
ncbi:MAG: EAL domain-containing protein [Longicatena sp.]